MTATLVADPTMRTTLREFLAGRISAPVAVARLLFRGDGPERLRELLRVHRLASEVAGRDAARLSEIEALLRTHEEGIVRVQELIHRHERLLGSRHERGVEVWRRFFDDSVRRSAEGSVAAYSLGSPELLEEGTREIVAFLDGGGFLAPRARVLEIGCGIGRLAAPLAGRVARYHGTDISLSMLTAARRRVPAPNATFSLSGGESLAELRDSSFDLVLAVDSFPYIHDAGPALVDVHFAEAARVLRRRGAFVLLNYSYAGDTSGENAEVATLAGNHGFLLEAAGVRPFRLWDGVLYLLRT